MTLQLHQNKMFERNDSISRRNFLGGAVAAALPLGLGAVSDSVRAAESAFNTGNRTPFRFHFITGSLLYGKQPLEKILPEMAKMNDEALDLWPPVHADHRKYIELWGEKEFVRRLRQFNLTCEIITRYDLKPDQLAGEFPVAQRIGAKMIITGFPRRRKGQSVKSEIIEMVDTLAPLAEKAGKFGLKLGIENHSSMVLETFEAIHLFAEKIDNPECLGIALAPYHLPQDNQELARLIEALGPKLCHYYAWQHGNGCMKPMPREKELLQLPGRGPLDFAPMIRALEKIRYSHRTEIFMHATPRGNMIHDSIEQVTTEIVKAKKYLERTAEQIVRQ